MRYASGSYLRHELVPSDGLNLQFSGPIGPFTKRLNLWAYMPSLCHQRYDPFIYLFIFFGDMVLLRKVKDWY